MRPKESRRLPKTRQTTPVADRKTVSDAGVATRGRSYHLDVLGGLVRDLTDEVITVTTARAEELFDDLVDTLGLGTSPA
jgi:hypothetical protein